MMTRDEYQSIRNKRTAAAGHLISQASIKACAENGLSYAELVVVLLAEVTRWTNAELLVEVDSRPTTTVEASPGEIARDRHKRLKRTRCFAWMPPGPPYYAEQCSLPPGHLGEHQFRTPGECTVDFYRSELRRIDDEKRCHSLQNDGTRCVLEAGHPFPHNHVY